MTEKHRLGEGPGGLTYEGYLAVQDLIRLQHCRSDPEHPDELLFIIVHQAYELWFKLILHEMEGAVRAMEADRPRRATHHLRRVAAVERLLVSQIHVLETMGPADFLGFRDRLNPASGFQSVQFREVEFLSGLREPRILEEFRHDPEARERLERRLRGPSLGAAFRDLLRRHGIPQPEGEAPSAAEARAQALADLYHRQESQPEIYDLAEALIEHDEILQLWRYHHMRMVERMIGHKTGTGGSEGVAYLETTLRLRLFPDLWGLRTRLRPAAGEGR